MLQTDHVGSVCAVVAMDPSALDWVESRARLENQLGVAVDLMTSKRLGPAAVRTWTANIEAAVDDFDAMELHRMTGGWPLLLQRSVELHLRESIRLVDAAARVTQSLYASSDDANRFLRAVGMDRLDDTHLDVWGLLLEFTIDFGSADPPTTLTPGDLRAFAEDFGGTTVVDHAIERLSLMQAVTVTDDGDLRPCGALGRLWNHYRRSEN
jgi:hypothetical protein